MAEFTLVDVYCPKSNCDFRGSVDADRYVKREAARRCPLCGATPVRIEIPGWSRGLAGASTAGLSTRP